MLRTSAILLAASALACAHAAAEAAAPPPKAAGDAAAFFPLAVGNEWTWLDLSAGAASGAGPKRTVRIVRRDPDGYFVDDARGELRVSHGCVQDRSRSLLCAPIETGRTWTSVVSESSTEHYEIAATGVTARVPAGTFAGCVLVRARNRAGPGAEVVLETTYAPGVGPVRIETYARMGEKQVPQVKAELASYRVEGPRR